MLLHILYEFTIHNHQCINDDIFSRMKNSSFTILFHRYKILNKDTFYYAHFFCLLSSNHKIYNLSYRSSSVNYWILLDNFPSHWLTVPTIYFALFIELSIQWKTFFHLNFRTISFISATESKFGRHIGSIPTFNIAIARIEASAAMSLEDIFLSFAHGNSFLIYQLSTYVTFNGTHDYFYLL